METAQRRATIQKLSGVPGYAGGGLIDSFKRSVGLAPPETLREKYARQDAEREARQPKAAQKAEPEVKAISSYAGNTALDRRMAEADMKAKGGPVKGKGGPTDDQVPIMASNGEFVLRSAAVKAIGLPALTALNKLGGDVPGSPNTTDNKFEEGGPINGSTINKYGTEVANTPAQGAQLANQSAAYVAGAQAANPQPAAQPAPQAQPAQSDYSRQMGEMGASFSRGMSNFGRALEVMGKTAISAPGYGFSSNNPTAPSEAVPFPGTLASAPKPAPLASPSAATMMQRQVGNAGSSEAREPYQSKYPVKAIDTLAGGAPTAPGNSFGDSASWNSNRQPMSAQDQGAMDGIQRRQDIADGNRAIKAQYDQEVAAAQAVNQATADQAYAHKYGGRAMRDMMRVRNEQQQTANTARGQDLTAKTTQRGQDIQATDSNQRNSIARDRLSMDSKGAELDNASKSKMMAAQDKLAMAQTDEEVAAATKTLRALQGKYGKEAPAEQYAYAPGGQEIDPESKQLVTRPGVIFNKATGQTVQQGAKPAALPSKDKLVPGQTYQTPRGNAVWDGKQFTPV